MDHWKGIGWRKSPTLHANALTLEAYVTDRWTKNPINTVYFDNVVFARSYIGTAVPRSSLREPTGGMSRPGARTGSRRGGSRISTGAWRSWTGRDRRDEDGQEGFACR
jgi:hypothetical protein